MSVIYIAEMIFCFLFLFCLGVCVCVFLKGTVVLPFSCVSSQKLLERELIPRLLILTVSESLLAEQPSSSVSRFFYVTVSSTLLGKMENLHHPEKIYLEPSSYIVL